MFQQSFVWIPIVRQVNKDITGALFVWIDGLVTSIQVAPCP